MSDKAGAAGTNFLLTVQLEKLGEFTTFLNELRDLDLLLSKGLGADINIDAQLSAKSYATISDRVRQAIRDGAAGEIDIVDTRHAPAAARAKNAPSPGPSTYMGARPADPQSGQTSRVLPKTEDTKYREGKVVLGPYPAQLGPKQQAVESFVKRPYRNRNEERDAGKANNTVRQTPAPNANERAEIQATQSNTQALGAFGGSIEALERNIATLVQAVAGMTHAVTKSGPMASVGITPEVVKQMTRLEDPGSLKKALGAQRVEQEKAERLEKSGRRFSHYVGAASTRITKGSVDVVARQLISVAEELLADTEQLGTEENNPKHKAEVSRIASLAERLKQARTRSAELSKQLNGTHEFSSNPNAVRPQSSVTLQRDFASAEAEYYAASVELGQTLRTAAENIRTRAQITREREAVRTAQAIGYSGGMLGAQKRRQAAQPMTFNLQTTAVMPVAQAIPEAAAAYNNQATQSDPTEVTRASASAALNAMLAAAPPSQRPYITAAATLAGKKAELEALDARRAKTPTVATLRGADNGPGDASTEGPEQHLSRMKLSRGNALVAGYQAHEQAYSSEFQRLRAGTAASGTTMWGDEKGERVVAVTQTPISTTPRAAIGTLRDETTERYMDVLKRSTKPIQGQPAELTIENNAFLAQFEEQAAHMTKLNRQLQEVDRVAVADSPEGALQQSRVSKTNVPRKLKGSALADALEKEGERLAGEIEEIYTELTQAIGRRAEIMKGTIKSERENRNGQLNTRRGQDSDRDTLVDEIAGIEEWLAQSHANGGKLPSGTLRRTERGMEVIGGGAPSEAYRALGTLPPNGGGGGPGDGGGGVGGGMAVFDASGVPPEGLRVHVMNTADLATAYATAMHGPRAPQSPYLSNQEKYYHPDTGKEIKIFEQSAVAAAMAQQREHLKEGTNYDQEVPWDLQKYPGASRGQFVPFEMSPAKSRNKHEEQEYNDYLKQFDLQFAKHSVGRQAELLDSMRYHEREYSANPTKPAIQEKHRIAMEALTQEIMAGGEYVKVGGNSRTLDRGAGNLLALSKGEATMFASDPVAHFGRFDRANTDERQRTLEAYNIKGSILGNKDATLADPAVKAALAGLGTNSAPARKLEALLQEKADRMRLRDEALAKRSASPHLYGPDSPFRPRVGSRIIDEAGLRNAIDKGTGSAGDLSDRIEDLSKSSNKVATAFDKLNALDLTPFLDQMGKLAKVVTDLNPTFILLSQMMKTFGSEGSQGNVLKMLNRVETQLPAQSAVAARSDFASAHDRLVWLNKYEGVEAKVARLKSLAPEQLQDFVDTKKGIGAADEQLAEYRRLRKLPNKTQAERAALDAKIEPLDEQRLQLLGKNVQWQKMVEAEDHLTQAVNSIRNTFAQLSEALKNTTTHTAHATLIQEKYDEIMQRNAAANKLPDHADARELETVTKDGMSILRERGLVTAREQREQETLAGSQIKAGRALNGGVVADLGNQMMDATGSMFGPLGDTPKEALDATIARNRAYASSLTAYEKAGRKRELLERAALANNEGTGIADPVAMASNPEIVRARTAEAAKRDAMLLSLQGYNNALRSGIASEKPEVAAVYAPLARDETFMASSKLVDSNLERIQRLRLAAQGVQREDGEIEALMKGVQARNYITADEQDQLNKRYERRQTHAEALKRLGISTTDGSMDMAMGNAPGGPPGVPPILGPLNKVPKLIPDLVQASAEQRKLTEDTIKHGEHVVRNTRHYDEMRKAMHASASGFDKFLNKFDNLMMYMGAGGILFSVVGAVQRGLRAAVQFEQEMAELQGIMLGDSVQDRAAVMPNILTQSTKYGIARSEVSQQYRAFAQAGIKGRELDRVAEASALGTRGLGLAPQQASELLIANRNVTEGRISGESIMDRISRVERSKAVSSQDLSIVLQRTGSIMEQLQPESLGGVDSQDFLIGAATEIIQKTRVSGNQAATSLRFMLSRIASPDVGRTLQDTYGINLAERSSGNLRPVTDILGDIARKYKELMTPQDGKPADTKKAFDLLATFAGARQVNAAAALFSDWDKVMGTSLESSRAFGDSQARLALQLDTLSTKLTQLSNAFEGFFIKLFNESSIGDLSKGAIGGATSALNALSEQPGGATFGLLGVGYGLKKGYTKFRDRKKNRDVSSVLAVAADAASMLDAATDIADLGPKRLITPDTVKRPGILSRLAKFGPRGASLAEGLGARGATGAAWFGRMLTSIATMAPRLASAAGWFLKIGKAIAGWTTPFGWLLTAITAVPLAIDAWRAFRGKSAQGDRVMKQTDWREVYNKSSYAEDYDAMRDQMQAGSRESLAAVSQEVLRGAIGDLRKDQALAEQMKLLGDGRGGIDMEALSNTKNSNLFRTLQANLANRMVNMPGRMGDVVRGANAATITNADGTYTAAAADIEKLAAQAFKMAEATNRFLNPGAEAGLKRATDLVDLRFTKDDLLKRAEQGAGQNPFTFGLNATGFRTSMDLYNTARTVYNDAEKQGFWSRLRTGTIRQPLKQDRMDDMLQESFGDIGAAIGSTRVQWGAVTLAEAFGAAGKGAKDFGEAVDKVAREILAFGPNNGRAATAALKLSDYAGSQDDDNIVDEIRRRRANNEAIPMLGGLNPVDVERQLLNRMALANSLATFLAKNTKGSRMPVAPRALGRVGEDSQYTELEKKALAEARPQDRGMLEILYGLKGQMIEQLGGGNAVLGDAGWNDMVSNFNKMMLNPQVRESTKALIEGKSSAQRGLYTKDLILQPYIQYTQRQMDIGNTERMFGAAGIGYDAVGERFQAAQQMLSGLSGVEGAIFGAQTNLEIEKYIAELNRQDQTVGDVLRTPNIDDSSDGSQRNVLGPGAGLSATDKSIEARNFDGKIRVVQQLSEMMRTNGGAGLEEFVGASGLQRIQELLPALEGKTTVGQLGGVRAELTELFKVLTSSKLKGKLSQLKQDLDNYFEQQSQFRAFDRQSAVLAGNNERAGLTLQGRNARAQLTAQLNRDPATAVMLQMQAAGAERMQAFRQREDEMLRGLTDAVARPGASDDDRRKLAEFTKSAPERLLTEESTAQTQYVESLRMEALQGRMRKQQYQDGFQNDLLAGLKGDLSGPLNQEGTFKQTVAGIGGVTSSRMVNGFVDGLFGPSGLLGGIFGKVTENPIYMEADMIRQAHADGITMAFAQAFATWQPAVMAGTNPNYTFTNAATGATPVTASTAGTGSTAVMAGMAGVAALAGTGVVNKNQDLLHPALRAKIAPLAMALSRRGLNMIPGETFRSQERQDWLHGSGRTRGGQQVTWTRNSKHTHGAAMDVQLKGAGTPEQRAAILEEEAIKLGLRTGRSFGDPFHVELPQRFPATSNRTRVMAGTIGDALIPPTGAASASIDAYHVAPLTSTSGNPTLDAELAVTAKEAMRDSTGMLKALEGDRRAAQRKALKGQAAGLVGTIGGGYLGAATTGRNKVNGGYAQTGAQLGTMLGTVIPGVGNVVGAVVGGALGGLLGGLFGKKKEEPQQLSALERIERNTRETISAIENATRTLTLDSRFLNAPSTFAIPSYSPQQTSGMTVGQITISIDGSQDPQAVAAAVAEELRRQGMSAGRFTTTRR